MQGMHLVRQPLVFICKSVSGLILFFYQTFAAVDFPELRLVDLAGGVADHVGENNLARAFVAGKVYTELVDFLFRQVGAFFHLNDGGRDLPKTFVRQANDGHIMNLTVCGQESLDLNGVEVFTAGNDNVLFAVHQEDKSVFILTCHISGM